MREGINYTYDFIIGVIHLDWNQDEQLLLYIFLRTPYRRSTACGQFNNILKICMTDITNANIKIQTYNILTTNIDFRLL